MRIKSIDKGGDYIETNIFAENKCFFLSLDYGHIDLPMPYTLVCFVLSRSWVQSQG